MYVNYKQRTAKSKLYDYIFDVIHDGSYSEPRGSAYSLFLTTMDRMMVERHGLVRQVQATTGSIHPCYLEGMYDIRQSNLDSIMEKATEAHAEMEDRGRSQYGMDKVPRLKEMLKSRGLSLHSGEKRPQMIDRLLKHDRMMNNSAKDRLHDGYGIKDLNAVNVKHQHSLPMALRIKQPRSVPRFDVKL